jgi:integrase
MTGTIRKRGEKCYQIRVSMGFDPKSGKRRRHEKTIHGTRKEAERYMREFLQSYETGRVVQPSDQALKDYLLYWIDNAKAGKLAERTLYDYRALVGLHFSGKIGKKALSHLRPLDIQDFYQSLSEYSISQRRQVHHILKPALRQAVNWGLIDYNPCDKVEGPRAKRREKKHTIRAMTEEQVARFLAVAEEDRWAVLWHLLLATGMRPQEAYALEWSEVDFARDTIRVVQSLYRRRGGEGGWELQPPKTERSRRSIVVPKSVMERLERHRQHQAAERAIHRPTDTDHDFVFACTNGSPLHERNLDMRHFKPTLKRAGLPSFRIYDARHSHITLLLLRGVSVKLISDRAGHSGSSLTLDTYSHVLPSMQRVAADELTATGLF